MYIRVICLRPGFESESGGVITGLCDLAANQEDDK